MKLETLLIVEAAAQSKLPGAHRRGVQLLSFRDERMGSHSHAAQGACPRAMIGNEAHQCSVIERSD